MFLYFLFKTNSTGDECVYVPVNQALMQNYTALERTKSTVDRNCAPAEINDKSNNYICLFILKNIYLKMYDFFR